MAVDGNWLAVSDFSQAARSVYLFASLGNGTFAVSDYVTDGAPNSLYGVSLALRVTEDNDVAVAVGYPDWPSADLILVGRVDTYLAKNGTLGGHHNLTKDKDGRKAGDYFGSALAYSHDAGSLAVGTPRIYTGLNATKPNAGQGSVFLRDDDNTYELGAEMTPDTTENNWFGFTETVIKRGSKMYLLAAAPAPTHDKDFDDHSPKPGSVYMYEGEDGSSSWMLKRSFNGDDDAEAYGWSIAATSSLVVVGSPYAKCDDKAMCGAATTFDPAHLPLQPLTIVGIVVAGFTGLAMIGTLALAMYYRLTGVEHIRGSAYSQLRRSLIQ
eukprot:TRINITY_DN926_c2_g1_i1.p1 TRINITY_DN926_c2_g1~~TRINITY_DN926_c2_g1_i1.p1  ORF type:complete len:325 (+),score=88.14 TRINITY_DN926_c2_g1_i1:449-1423(+)